MTTVNGSPSAGGRWSPTALPRFDEPSLIAAVGQVRDPLHVVEDTEAHRVGVSPVAEVSAPLRLLGTLPPLHPEWLGDRSFCEVHRLRFPYVAGEMANGIATVRLVEEMARAGMLGFFGAAGLSPQRVESAVDALVQSLGEKHSWGVNLIHSPNEPDLEEHVADLLIRKGVARISASAYMALTPAVVRCVAAGLTVDNRGRIHRARHLFAKVSRPEVARLFLSPAPAEILRVLLERKQITETEATLAGRIPLAEDVTVEADSGGHTDNRPLVGILPLFLQLRDQLAAQYGYERPIRIGAAGGLGTPGAVSAAFALGAAYVLTGSVNQAAVESGLSEAGRRLLAKADVADVAMAPAADMFELGVEVQVLKRGTMFASRARRLYEFYKEYASLDSFSPTDRTRLENDLLHTTLTQAWDETRSFWEKRDPREIERAAKDPKHQMALVFRWYLGKSSRWAIEGEASRLTDYQIWCGPAMGAFNDWVKGSFLEEPSQRTAVQIARNLLEGAAVLTRAQQLRTFGAPIPSAAFRFTPRRLD